jgi:hypothetical protein
MKKILILILGFPFILYCCKDPEPIHHEPNSELKEWGVFQKGTWWVYQEENTKAIDSIWVDSVTTSEFQLDKKKSPYIFEKGYSTYLSSIFKNETMVYAINSMTNHLKFIKIGNNGQEFSERCYLLEIPFKKGLTAGYGPSWVWAEIDTIYDSIKLENRYFKNVPRVYDNGNPAFNLDTTYFYTARNLGIIRKEFPDNNEVWNLIRFKIVQ